MQIKDFIPTEALSKDNTKAFIKVLDGVLDFKRTLIGGSKKCFVAGVNTDKKWILRQLTDFGFERLDENLPLESLQLLSINAANICSHWGSHVGLGMFISAICQGMASYNIEVVKNISRNLYLNSDLYGYLTWDSQDSHKFLVWDSDDLSMYYVLNLTVELPSKYDTEETRKAISQAIETNLKKFVGLTFRNINVDYQFTLDTEYYHSKLYSYFK